MERRNGHRAPETPGSARRRHIAIVTALVVLLAIAFVGGYLLARGDDTASPSGSFARIPRVAGTQA